MRIPLYPGDLLPKRGFKRLATRFQRNWPSAEPMTLSQSREILARALGYHDYHDARLSSASAATPAQVPSEAETRNQIVLTIKHALDKDTKSAVTMGELQAFVLSLPLHALEAFAHLRPEQSPPNVKTGDASPSVSEVSVPNALMTSALNSPSGAARPMKRILNGRIMSVEELNAIKGVVRQQGNLADQLFLEMVMTGLRLQEIRHSVINASGEIVIGLRRSPAAQRVLTAHDFPQETLLSYAKENALRAGDFLFPSGRNPKSPTSAATLSTRFKTWASRAGVDGGLTFNSMRDLVILQLIKALQHHDLSLKLRHKNKLHTMSYIREPLGNFNQL